MFDNNEKDLFGDAGLDLGGDFVDILGDSNPFDDPTGDIAADTVQSGNKTDTGEKERVAEPDEKPQPAQGEINSEMNLSADDAQTASNQSDEEDKNETQTDLQKNNAVSKNAEQNDNGTNNNAAASIFDEAIAKAENKEAENTKSGLIDKLPVFSYASAQEDIVDTSKTFDQIRIEKAEDFPELDDAAAVTWKMVYGSISKNIPTPKKTTVASMKKKIEESDEFLKSLKKAKGDIVCKVVPSVVAKKKGMVSYIGAFESVEQAVKSGKTIGYVPSEDGRIYEVRPNKIGTFIAPARNIRGFQKVRAGFIPALPKIPEKLLMQVISFFKSFVNEKETVEAMAYVYYSYSDDMFYVYVPRQTVSKTEVNTTLPEIDEEKFTLVMEIHSHNTMEAFFSEIDDRDEKATRLYAVVGRLDKLFPDIKTRASVGGKFIDIEPDVVFDIKNEEFPLKWREAVRIREHSGKDGLYL